MTAYFLFNKSPDTATLELKPQAGVTESHILVLLIHWLSTPTPGKFRPLTIPEGRTLREWVIPLLDTGTTASSAASGTEKAAAGTDSEGTDSTSGGTRTTAYAAGTGTATDLETDFATGTAPSRTESGSTDSESTSTG